MTASDRIEIINLHYSLGYNAARLRLKVGPSTPVGVIRADLIRGLAGDVLPGVARGIDDALDGRTDRSKVRPGAAPEPERWAEGPAWATGAARSECASERPAAGSRLDCVVPGTEDG